MPSPLDTVHFMLRYCFDSMRHHLQQVDVAIFLEQIRDLPVTGLEQLQLAMIRNRV